MDDKKLKVLKLVVPVASLAIGFASNYLKNKEFDEKVAKKVAELTKSSEEKS